jgi:hypothetical protein
MLNCGQTDYVVSSFPGFVYLYRLYLAQIFQFICYFSLKKHFLKIKALRAQWTSVQHASDALPNSRGPPRLRSSGDGDTDTSGALMPFRPGKHDELLPGPVPHVIV